MQYEEIIEEMKVCLVILIVIEKMKVRLPILNYDTDLEK